MKTILSLRRHHYLKTVGILLIAVALIVGTISCDGVTEYDLTMAENPAAGGTATDETGTSPYARNDVVDIKAVPADCYRFVDWSTTAGAIGNATAAETTFTMPAEDVTVTANFELTPPDHFEFYNVAWETAPYVGEDVQLVDQFGTFNATVGEAVSFGNPVKKVHTGVTPMPISDPNNHLTLYELDYGEEEPMLDSWQVTVHNQFQDDVELTVIGPYYLAVPTQKGDHEEWKCLNHYLVYDVILSSWLEEPIAVVNLTDQFHDELAVGVWDPALFANPVQKTVGSEVTEIETDDHLVFYYIEGCPIDKKIQIDNQFGSETLDLLNPEYLAVPSQKISVEQPLDHFECYWAEWGEEPPPTFPVPVQLEDQFITAWLGEPLSATVLWPELFANPVNKEHGIVWTPISSWDDHYTFYLLDYEEVTPVWWVKVSNQFDPLVPLVEPPVYQELYVSGPVYLAVPTKKGPHDWPVDLDHFLVYDVLPGPPIVGAEVYLRDQFAEHWTNVGEPAYFANPVKKIDASGPTDIMYPDDHLVLYWIDGFYFPTIDDLPIDNQFGPQFLNVWPLEDDLLGVPSQKIDFSIAPD